MDPSIIIYPTKYGAIIDLLWGAGVYANTVKTNMCLWKDTICFNSSNLLTIQMQYKYILIATTLSGIQFS